MIHWFTESSLVPVITGVLLGMCFMGLAISFRDRIMFYIALGIACLTLATVAIELMIVTDREVITDTVYLVADAVQQNDVETILEYVGDDCQDTRDRIRREMSDYQVSLCRVVGFNDVTIEDGKPKTALVDFVVWGEGRAYRQRASVHRRIQLNIRKESDGKWKMYDYSHSDPQGYLNL